ncbi:hypothetical protein IHE45_16G049800 [Dioscorea alata]|uniref:Uncharacterized protein n=1 Tax=Dioscorea alata TaxID=55571 RepID=A0ACB7UHI1_DIOAL|nr:hypothetical protein IHE45_16G049800 [Dioscorea alata]
MVVRGSNPNLCFKVITLLVHGLSFSQPISRPATVPNLYKIIFPKPTKSKLLNNIILKKQKKNTNKKKRF